MKLSYFPQIKVVHTSKVFHGQVYVPMLNWLMMVGTVLVAAIYNNTTSLGNAYGVCVIFVTFFDSCMVALAAILVWRVHPLMVFFPWLIIACIDGLFLSSALTKVPDGAWFTLTLAAVLAAVFILWRFGKENQWKAEAADRFQPNVLVKKTDDGKLVLTDRYGGTELSKVRGFGIFFDKAGEMSPTVWIQFLSKLVAVPEVMVFFHLRPLETPSVAVEDRYTITRIGNLPNCYRLVVRHGYMDEVITPNLASLIFQQVRDFLIRRQHRDIEDKKGEQLETSSDLEPTINSESTPTQQIDGTTLIRTTGIDLEHQTAIEEKNQIRERSLAQPNSELSILQHAFDAQTLYIIGKESLKITEGTNFFRRLALRTFLFIRENTRTKIANLRVPTERVIEVGFVKEI
jgi:KUP system potassium uptake protein